MHPYIIGRLAEVHRQDLLSETARQRASRSRTKAGVGRFRISVQAAIVEASLRGFIVFSRQVGRRLSFIGRVAQRETWQP